MDKFSIQNISKLTSLQSEFELEKATSVFLKLRVLAKEDKLYEPIRRHLSKLIKNYEDKYWTDEDNVSDFQVKESDLAESLIIAEDEFYKKRKQLIKSKLKSANINQNDLAKILGHSKTYVSELINGLRPFSKEDIVIINRLFKIKFDDLIPTFIKQDKAIHIKNTLRTLSNKKLKLSIKDFDLEPILT